MLPNGYAECIIRNDYHILAMYSIRLSSGLFRLRFVAISCIIASTSLLIQRGNASANEFVPCSFNRQIITCKVSFSNDYTNPRIQWSDSKSQTYYGKAGNGNILRDSLGGEWRYLDFAVGRSWSLTNITNGNVIIWNGTYKDFGSYVGL